MYTERLSRPCCTALQSPLHFLILCHGIVPSDARTLEVAKTLDPQHHSYFFSNFNFNYSEEITFHVLHCSTPSTSYPLSLIVELLPLLILSLSLLHNRSSFSAARDASVSTELYLRPPKKREGNICNRLIEYIFSYWWISDIWHVRKEREVV